MLEPSTITTLRRTPRLPVSTRCLIRQVSERPRRNHTSFPRSVDQAGARSRSVLVQINQISCRYASTMGKPTALLIGGLTHVDKEWHALGEKYNLKEFREGTREQFLEKLSNDFSDVNGVYRSNTSVAQTGPFDRELCNALPKSLRYVCHNGAGYDNIDVAPFTEKGIQISSTPIAVDNATADTGIFLMLGALRYATIPLLAIRAGQWKGEAILGHDPNGKVLGILGSEYQPCKSTCGLARSVPSRSISLCCLLCRSCSLTIAVGGIGRVSEYRFMSNYR